MGPGAYKHIIPHSGDAMQPADMPFQQSLMQGSDVRGGGPGGYMAPVMSHEPARGGGSALPSRSNEHHTLYVSELPTSIDMDVLYRVFGNLSGLEELRPVLERGVAFAQFESIAAASGALDKLLADRMLAKAIDERVRVTYANR